MSFNQSVTEKYPLNKVTWFQVGGNADYFYKARTLEGLQEVIRLKPKNMPCFILGAGSNILVRDGGIRGLVIKLAGDFTKWHIENDDTLIVGAAVLDKTIALNLADLGFSNLEFLVGIPGTIGGAVYMNAGAFGTETKDHLLWVKLMDDQGAVVQYDASSLNMQYRKGNIPKNHIVLQAAFKLKSMAPTQVQEKIQNILSEKEAAQPMTGRTGGSTFKNPYPHSAWSLIDKVGGRGLRNGNAQVSEKHCNFLLNLGGATAQEIEDLGDTLRERVLSQEGIQLEWEIIRIGDPAIN
ncbi:MAG: UDP-N-acetylmuramate dehydrogenase [Alphaproteobacteria bacterium]|nr:UDP-N-acetylmuramate dehydrogenase [Alphaproteobacteria bacterium]